MGRKPYQILAIPYILCEDNIKYCVFKRKNPGNQYQFIAGGGEGDESIVFSVLYELHNRLLCGYM